jgi:4-hydroxybenzoyl-CoA reductase subunit beta
MLRLPPFAYHEPATLDEAIARKEDAGDEGMFVAGGTDLYPNMKRRHQEPATVIALSKIPSLVGITPEAGDRGCRIAAMTTLTEIASSAALDETYRAVAHAASLVSTPLLRNMGTIGGNLCLDTRCTYYNQSCEWRKSIDFCMKKDGAICWVAPKSPRCWAVQSSDLAPVMVALGADLVLRSRESERVVPAARFYHDDGINYLTKRPHEMLTEIRLPARNGWDLTYWKLRRRGSFDFPVLGVAAWVRWEDGQVADARIVLGGVASYPQTVPAAATAIVGSALDDDAVAAAANAAFKPSKPMDNTDFGLAWRKEMTRTYVRRALTELRSRQH